jgi:hypothetical protein
MDDLEQLLLLEVCLKRNEFWIRVKIPSKIWISKNWILRYIVVAIANPPLPKIEEGMIQGGLQRLLYHLKDMRKLTL